MKYKLLAADMDSTALNSKKELTPRTVAAEMYRFADELQRALAEMEELLLAHPPAA